MLKSMILSGYRKLKPLKKHRLPSKKEPLFRPFYTEQIIFLIPNWDQSGLYVVWDYIYRIHKSVRRKIISMIPVYNK